jgi:glycosyltransferase involved in cell wall biosynthesis
MKIIMSHPTSNGASRAVADSFLKAGLLTQFHTAVATFPGSLLDSAGAISFLSEIRRRRFNPALRPAIQTWPWLEAGRIVAGKLGYSRLTQHETGIFSVDAVYRNIDRRVAARLPALHRQGVNAVYAYEDGAEFTFQAAKRLGITCLYDLPIGYWRAARRLMQVEQERWPAWASTLTGLVDSADKLQRKDEELRLADRIYVASKFTADTLREFPGPLAPIEILPYGFPPVGQPRTYEPLGNRPLKLLFVGGLSQRKGIADLFAAVDALGSRVSLTVVGRKATEDCAALNQALTKHRWIPSLPHEAVLALMREHDALVFPSLFEGFGLVITEAMSQGTPVITTDRTAGPDLIRHGENGWLIEAGSTPALQEAIEELLRHPESIAANGRAAMDSARSRPWELYEQELAASVSRPIA